MNLYLRIARRLFNSTFYCQWGITKGKNVDIRRCAFFDKPERISIGDNSLINYVCSFHVGLPDDTIINIGNNVQIGMNCVFTCVKHNIGTEFQSAGKHIYQNIKVEDGAWIEASCTILPNVPIAKGCIVDASSVVTASSLPNGLYAGVPARRIKDIY